MVSGLFPIESIYYKMDDLPLHVTISFYGCVVACFAFIYYAVFRATGKNSSVPTFVVTFIGIWFFILALLTIQGYFRVYNTTPPRLVPFGVGALLVIATLLLIPGIRAVVKAMPITTLTYIHIIRVPVEIILWWLFIAGALPKELTFEGVNFDIITGISAPFAGLFFVGLKSKSKFAALAWNVLALGALFNVVIRAVMATPYFYHEDLYETPNIAVFHFPFILLPLFIVPSVLFCHIASIYKLLVEPEEIY